MDVRVGLWRKLSAEELMLLNCGVGEDSWESSLEGLMLKLKLQYFGHLMPRTDSFEKTLMLGDIEGRRKRGWQRMRRLDGITDSMDMSLSKLRSWWWTGRPSMLRSMGSQRVGRDWATELNFSCTGTTVLSNYKVILVFLSAFVTKVKVPKDRDHQ